MTELYESTMHRTRRDNQISCLIIEAIQPNVYDESTNLKKVDTGTSPVGLASVKNKQITGVS